MSKITDNSSINKGNKEKILFTDVNKKSIEVNLDSMSLSSFGGILMLRKEDERISLSKRLASCVKDKRNQCLIRHSMEELFMTRIFQVCLGYEDVNDCDRNRMDPMMRLAVGERYDKELCSSATMCRFENMVTDEDLDAIQEMFVAMFILSYKGEDPGSIILDCDDTNVDTYGCQEQTLFNNYYGNSCYMSLLIFEGHSGKLVLPMLRPGRRNKTANICDTLQWLIGRLRAVWPKVVITVRGDSHFCSHEFMDWVRGSGDKKLFFITGIASNSVLSWHPVTRRLMREVLTEYGMYGVPVRRYGRIDYKADSWGFCERVTVKVEITKMKGLNIRYIVSNIPTTSDGWLYSHTYCGRGNDELYIREFKEAVSGDRLSCHSFKANRFRTFIYAAAYVLMHSIRESALAGTSLENATLLGIRERLLLVSVCVRVLKTKVVLEYASYNPMERELRHALLFYGQAA